MVTRAIRAIVQPGRHDPRDVPRHEGHRPQLAENQLIFPNEETLSNAYIFRALSGAEEQKYQSQFQQILLGS